MKEALLPTGVADTASVLASWPIMQDFYLSGGTALALQQGHRQSRDLDFFTRQPLTVLPELPGTDAFLARFGNVEWILRAPDQIHWRLDGVSVTLLAYPFAHAFPFRSWRGLAVADARDIAVQKAYTLGRRAQARDYLDLHTILQTGVLSLDEVIHRAQNTYHGDFSARLFLQQLTYTRDLPDRDEALNLLTTPHAFDVIERELQTAVRQWIAQHVAAPTPQPPQGPRL
ncbi:MAG: nucleotidyl transferase AbiEii/AbiGii toxin family protein [Thermaerobacter sp.]|nr:nucleotidyl transferase AbiEii/AbiGii toxin family protein [Thermaerobacter sp.]